MPSKRNQGILRFFNPKNLDFIGSELQLNYTPNGRFQTKVGGFISFTVAFLVSLVVYTSFRNLLSTDSPVATVSTVYSRKGPRFDLLKEKVFFHYGFFNQGRAYSTIQEMSEINKFVTIKGFLFLDQGIHPNGDRIASYEFELVFKPCSQLVDTTILEDLMQHKESRDMIHFFGLCPELASGRDKYFVQSKLQDPPSYAIRLFVFPCSLPNSSDCASISEFRGTQLLHTNTRKGFDVSNYENPLYSIVEFDGYQQIDPAISKLVFYKIRDNEVWDDTHDFFEKRLRAKTADYFLDYRDSRTRNINQLHCDAKILNVPNQIECEPYISISIISSGEKRVIVRTYSKFFNTLGEIGGTAEIFMIFAFLVYFKYNSFYLTKFLKREVFEVKSIKKLKRFFFKGKYKKSAKINSGQHLRGQGEDFNQQIREQRDVPGQSRRFGENRNQNKILKEEAFDLKQVNKLLNEQIKESLSGVSLFRSLNELKILRKIFLKPKHRKLLPMVLLNIKRQESLQNHQENQVGPLPTNSNLSVDQALEQLNSEEPKSEIEKIIDEYIIDHLPLKRAPKVEEKPPPPPSPQIPPPFKFNLSEGRDQFSELNTPGEGLSDLESPRLSLKSQLSSLRSIPSKIPNNPTRGQRNKMSKMSIFRTLKSNKKVSTSKKILVRNNLQGERTRNLKKYGHPGEGREVQINQLPEKEMKRARPRFTNKP